MSNQNQFKGYSLFNDITDTALRIRNQSVVLCNIAESNVVKGLISPRGAALILGYFNFVSPADRGTVKEEFKTRMGERGFKLA